MMKQFLICVVAVAVLMALATLGWVGLLIWCLLWLPFLIMKIKSAADGECDSFPEAGDPDDLDY